MEDTTLLPIPVRDELVTVFDAVGSHVAWPKDDRTVPGMGPASGKLHQKSTEISAEPPLKLGLPNLYLQAKYIIYRSSGHSRTTGVPTTARINNIP